MGKIEVIPFTTEENWLQERAKDVTSTQVSALFGCCPYLTEFELFNQRVGKYIREFSGNERTKWGTRLESAIAMGISEEKGWPIRPMKEYIRDTEINAGSSFDFAVLNENGTDAAILEIKNVDFMQFKTEWAENDDGSIEAPPHIELQVQHQLMLTGFNRAFIGVLIAGNQMKLIEREPMPEIHEQIKIRIGQFNEDIRAGNTPNPDFSRDMNVINQLYNYSTPGKIETNLSEDLRRLASRYKKVNEDIKMLEVSKDELKAEMLSIIDDAEKVIGADFSITASLVKPTRVEFDRKGYRSFRVNWVKEKKT